MAYYSTPACEKETSFSLPLERPRPSLAARGCSFQPLSRRRMLGSKFTPPVTKSEREVSDTKDYTYAKLKRTRTCPRVSAPDNGYGCSIKGRPSPRGEIAEVTFASLIAILRKVRFRRWCASQLIADAFVKVKIKTRLRRKHTFMLYTHKYEQSGVALTKKILHLCAS